MTDLDPAAYPLVVWFAVAGALLYVTATAVAKIVDPISEVFEKRRAYKQREEDARIVDLSHQVDHLAGRVYTLEQRQQRQDQALRLHAGWDHDLISAAIAAGVKVTDPPPLWPPLDDI